MEVIDLKFKGAYLIKPDVFKDSRGFFLESYNKKNLSMHGIDIDFIQDNHSKSLPIGTIRGLHFQREPFSQTKLVRVTKGSIYDVIVDLRPESETFCQWDGYHLSSDNFNMLLVPKRFAHGFCTLENNTEVMYKVDNYYSKEHDSGIIWNDSTLKINWLINEPILSNKDKKHPTLKSWLSGHE